MPNTNVYHLYIHPDGIEKKDPVAGKKSPMSTEEKQSARFEKALVGLVSYHSLKGTIDKIANFNIGQVSLTTGASEYEQRLQSSYDIVGFAADTAYSAALSFTAGGPALMALNLATKAVNMAMDLSMKYAELNNKKNLENISIGMSYIRAGAAGRRGSD